MKLLLVSYNILFGHDPRVFDSLKTVREESKKHTHTIIALQEVRNKTILDTLPETLKKLFRNFHSAQLIFPKPSLHNLGLMTFSSLPILDRVPVLLPRVLSRTPLHGALMTRYKVGKKILRVTNVHFNVMGGVRHKKKQMLVLSDYLQFAHADYDIVCGDFNTIGPWKIQKNSVLKQKNLIYKYLGKTFYEVPIASWTCDVQSVMSPLLPGAKFIHKTFNKTGITFRQKLDWVFVRGFKKMEAEVRHDLMGSDHYPIFATLEI